MWYYGCTTKWKNVFQKEPLTFSYSNAPRIPPSQLGWLDDWRLAGLENWKAWKDWNQVEISWSLNQNLRKFQDFGTKKRFRNGLGGLWEHILTPRGNQTRLVESWRAQMSPRGSKKDRQKGAKTPARTLIWKLLHPFLSENVIQMAAMRGKSKKSEIRKTIEKTMVFQWFSLILGYLGAEKSWKTEEIRIRNAKTG